MIVFDITDCRGYNNATKMSKLFSGKHESEGFGVQPKKISAFWETLKAVWLIIKRR